MTRSETMLEDNVCPNFEDPLFHSMSVIDGSEKEKKTEKLIYDVQKFEKK